MAAIFLAVIVRYATEAALRGVYLSLSRFGSHFSQRHTPSSLLGTWANRRQPGMAIAFVGVLSNATVILVNGGYMPIWEPSLLAAGLTPADVTNTLHVLLPPPIDGDFLRHLGPLADIVPIPIPLVPNVASLGDVVISLGLSFFLFASVVRTPEEVAEEDGEARPDHPEPIPGVVGAVRTRGDLPRSSDVASVVNPGTGLVSGLSEASVLQRPVLLGSEAPGLVDAAAAWSDFPPRMSAEGFAATLTSASPSTRRSPPFGPVG